jgi:hypothetical protein
MFRFVVAAASLLAAASPVAAADPQPQAPGQGQLTVAQPKEKKICRVDPSTTGSILPSRTCHTQAEWDQINQRSQEQAGLMLDRQDQTTTGATR